MSMAALLSTENSAKHRRLSPGRPSPYASPGTHTLIPPAVTMCPSCSISMGIDNGACIGYHLPRAVPRGAQRAQKWRKPFAAKPICLCGKIFVRRAVASCSYRERELHFGGGDLGQSSLISPPKHSVGEDARRSTRIERSVPLIVFGQNRMGEPFVERTVSTSLNLHGCRYPSRHDYGVGSWVTLQVVGLNVEPKPPAVRARVRSVHTSQSARELQQVGVELENPGNVWGIVTPPQDWMTAGATRAPRPQFATAVAPTLEAPPPVAEEVNEPPVNTEHRMAEVATFPSPSPAVSNPPAPKLAEPPQNTTHRHHPGRPNRRAARKTAASGGESSRSRGSQESR